MLINCPECGTEVSDKAINCPKCGNPLETIRENENTINNDIIKSSNNFKHTKSKRILLIAVIILLSILGFLFYKSKNSSKEPIIGEWEITHIVRDDTIITKEMMDLLEIEEFQDTHFSCNDYTYVFTGAGDEISNNWQIDTRPLFTEEYDYVYTLDKKGETIAVINKDDLNTLHIIMGLFDNDSPLLFVFTREST